jgi:uncharacterized protein YcfL
MKKIISFQIFVLILLLTSCETNNNLVNLDDELKNKIPVDSIYFSCKINGQSIQFKSPNAENGSWEKAVTRLKRIKNSTKDSILVSYRQSFYDEYYIVEIGFSESILMEIDTTSNWLTVPSQKSVLLKKGIHNIQYLEHYFDYNEATVKYCGFMITITDRINRVNYSSYIRFRDPNTYLEYNDFKSKSLFEITELAELNTGIYKDYVNAWFFNSKFNCKLYINSESKSPVNLTDGVLNCCF